MISGPSEDAVGITAMRASGPPARVDELREHGALAELVLGSSDDEQVAVAAPGWTVGSQWHDRKPKGWDID